MIVLSFAKKTKLKHEGRFNVYQKTGHAHGPQERICKRWKLIYERYAFNNGGF